MRGVPVRNQIAPHRDWWATGRRTAILLNFAHASIPQQRRCVLRYFFAGSPRRMLIFLSTLPLTFLSPCPRRTLRREEVKSRNDGGPPPGTYARLSDAPFHPLQQPQDLLRRGVVEALNDMGCAKSNGTTDGQNLQFLNRKDVTSRHRTWFSCGSDQNNFTAVGRFEDPS